MPKIITFGVSSTDHLAADKRLPDYAARNLIFNQGLPCFDLCHQDSVLPVQLKIPGAHNVLDALAAVACAHENGASMETAAAVLNSFQGAEGRFTDIGYYRGARVISDYAHHPSAAKATLTAAEQIPHKRLWVVFQPLTFSRTRVLFDDYVSVLKPYHVVFSEIFSDRETDPGDISSRMLADHINQQGGDAIFTTAHDQIQQWLDERVQPGDIVLVLGPENIRDYADQLTGRTSHLDN